MRCLCYAKFLSSGAVPPGEFFAHIDTKWSCIENIPKAAIKASNHDMTCNRLLP